VIGRWCQAGATWEYVPEVTVNWHHDPEDL
jgi:hypothetical protein